MENIPCLKQDEKIIASLTYLHLNDPHELVVEKYPYGECLDCRYHTQSEGCCVCCHPEAREEGNGGYIYHGFACDINKFTPHGIKYFHDGMQRKLEDEVAEEVGWIKKEKTNYYADGTSSQMIYYEKNNLKKINHEHINR